MSNLSKSVNISPESHRTIPFFNYPGLFAEHEKEFMATIQDVLSRGAYIMQKDLFEFEESLAQWLGVKHVLGVADGTVALVLALKLAGIGPGDEVILPSHTFVATASAVSHVGATPVICDCGPDHMINIDTAEQLISRKTRAVMPVQLNGRTCDMDKVQAFAIKHNLKIVEDSCQALGSRFRGQAAGTFGVAGSFSFYPAKVLGCFGDGGALILNDDENAVIARQYRDHGRDATTGKVVRFGYNARLDNLQAAIMKVKFKYYDRDLAQRRKLAALYQSRLGSVEALKLPPAPDVDNLRFDIFQNYEVQAKNRNQLRTFLLSKGIGTIVQWGGHMVHQFEELKLKHFAPYAEELSKTFLLLPMHHLLHEDDINYICDAIEDFYRSN
jgi:dTDP-4-amino-4,6-dideoxygalactose transaminase